MVLLMSVNPGFGGQAFIPSTLAKLAEARRIIDASGRDIRLEVDGGIKVDNIGEGSRGGRRYLRRWFRDLRHRGLRRHHRGHARAAGPGQPDGLTSWVGTCTSSAGRAWPMRSASAESLASSLRRRMPVRRWWSQPIGGMTDVLLGLVDAASNQGDVAPQLATLKDRYHRYRQRASGGWRRATD